MVLENISEETTLLIQKINELPLDELVGVGGDIRLPRPTLDELYILATAPESLVVERRLVIEAYEKRLSETTALAEQRYTSSQHALDEEVIQRLAKTS